MADENPLKKFVDERGWLTELWRTDNVEASIRPVMTYVSQLVKRGVARFNHGFYNIKAEARPYWED